MITTLSYNHSTGIEMTALETALEQRLTQLATAMVNQHKAVVTVPPQQNAPGFWFGGGNMVESPDGKFYLVGRYRNHGDSRTGITAGERGVELAIFCSQDRGNTFQKAFSFSKNDLNVGDREVLSIEGSALRFSDTGVELFVSTEKTNLDYPDGLEMFLKPGTGVWTIDYLTADSIKSLAHAEVDTILESRDSRFLHVKDPFVYESLGGDLSVFFCSHPFGWTSSNTGYAIRRFGETKFQSTCYEFFPRGFTWDVAMTRATAMIDVPQIGEFRSRKVSLLFYDGGESVRKLDEHGSAVRRPRGYSCEELGGLAYVVDNDLAQIHRLSKNLPLFISPWGTGCSRYVDVLQTQEGLFVTWQQSQEDQSQPLVMNFLGNDEITEILG